MFTSIMWGGNMPFNYSTLWTFSQQAETKTKNKLLFFWGSFSFPRKMRHLRTSCETEQVKGQQQTNKTANNSSVLNLFLQWLFAWFVFFALCLVASYGAPLHTVTERSVLGCIRMAMEKHHPHRLWVMQQTHVCITQNNCIASISKNLVMPFSPFSLTLVSFPPTVKDTNKKTNKAQASETVTPELLITKWY